MTNNRKKLLSLALSGICLTSIAGYEIKIPAEYLNYLYSSAWSLVQLGSYGWQTHELKNNQLYGVRLTACSPEIIEWVTQLTQEFGLKKTVKVLKFPLLLSINGKPGSIINYNALAVEQDTIILGDVFASELEKSLINQDQQKISKFRMVLAHETSHLINNDILTRLFGLIIPLMLVQGADIYTGISANTDGFFKHLGLAYLKSFIMQASYISISRFREQRADDFALKQARNAGDLQAYANWLKELTQELPLPYLKENKWWQHLYFDPEHPNVYDRIAQFEHAAQKMEWENTVQNAKI